MPRKDTQFRSGSEWNGNAAGRPKGSKSKLTESFLEALTKNFAKHGQQAIARVCQDEPAQYLKIIASLMPKELLLEISQEEKPQWVINASPKELTTLEWQKMHGILNVNSEPAKLENNQLINQKKQES